jgi:hypothetical protein
MQVQTLKRNNWNVIRLYSINFFNNPKREIKKIKEYLDKLTSATGKITSNNFKRSYRFAKLEDIAPCDGAKILSGERDADIIKAIKAIVAAEEPISLGCLIKRTLGAFGITKWGTKLEGKVKTLIDGCGFKSAKMVGNTYYYKSEKALSYDKYRVEDNSPIRSSDIDFTPYDIIALVKAILLDKVSMYADELIILASKQLKITRPSDKLTLFFGACLDEGVRQGLFIRSISDKISLA